MDDDPLDGIVWTWFGPEPTDEDILDLASFATALWAAQQESIGEHGEDCREGGRRQSSPSAGTSRGVVRRSQQRSR